MESDYGEKLKATTELLPMEFKLTEMQWIFGPVLV